MMGSVASGGSSVEIEVPATTTAVDTFTKALSRGYLCEVKMYEFDSRKENQLPQSSQTTIVSHLGEVVGLAGTFTSLTVEIGSALIPIGAQAPPRKFTTYQIGAPIRI